MRFHIVKRDSCPFWKKLCLYLAAVAGALVLGGLLLLVMGVDPIAYYQRMFTMGMVGNKIAYKTFENYLKVFVPLVLTSVALSLAFKMRFWNIGGEGQFILGAVAAAAVALKLKDSLPHGMVDVYKRQVCSRCFWWPMAGISSTLWWSTPPQSRCWPVFRPSSSSRGWPRP